LLQVIIANVISKDSHKIHGTYVFNCRKKTAAVLTAARTTV